MKVAVTSFGSAYSDKVDPRFGRAAYFMVYDEDKGSWQCANNQQNLEAAQGAGIQAAQTIRQLGADVLITGNVGPKAFKVLSVSGIKVYSAAELTVEKAYEMFKNGRLTELAAANVEGHWV